MFLFFYSSKSIKGRNEKRKESDQELYRSENKQQINALGRVLLRNLWGKHQYYNKLVAVFLLPCSSPCSLSLVLYNVLHAFDSNNTDKVLLPPFIDTLHDISSKNLGNDTQHLRFSLSQQYQLPLFDKLGLVDELENYLGPVSRPDEA